MNCIKTVQYQIILLTCTSNVLEYLVNMLKKIMFFKYFMCISLHLDKVSPQLLAGAK